MQAAYARTVEVVTRPSQASICAIPDFLEAYLASSGRRAHLGTRTEQLVPYRTLRLGRERLLAADLPGDIVTKLKSRGYKVDAQSGELLFGDTVIWVQALENQPRHRSQQAQEWASMTTGYAEEVNDKVAELARETGGAAFGGAFDRSTGRFERGRPLPPIKEDLLGLAQDELAAMAAEEEQ